MKKVQLTSAVWKEGRHYVAQCLNVDVASFGATKTKAIKNLKEALELYFDDVPISEVITIKKPSLKTHQQFVYV